jgi:hypothetical protein
LARAESAYRHSLVIKRRFSGNESPTVPWSLCGLGSVLEHDGKLTEAETLYREALAIQNTLLQNGNGSVAESFIDSFNNLLSILEKQNKPIEIEAAVREAVTRGHAYVAHDWLCDSTGFAFVARTDGNTNSIMGDEVNLDSRPTLSAATPLTCTMKLVRNGEVIQTTNANRLSFEVKVTGVYRIEAWLEVDGEHRPWIYSNPIYIR